MPSVTDWITAVTAVLALLAAVWAGTTARRLHGIESDRDRRTREAAVREQARNINAWCVVTDPAGRRRDGLLVSNTSDSPVYAVEVRSQDRNERVQFPLTLTLLPPGDFVVVEDATYHWTFPESVESMGVAIRPVTKHEYWRVTEVTFADSSGVTWRRDRDGQLTQLE